MTVPTNLLAAANGLAVAAYGLAPPDQATMGLLQEIVNLAALIPASYVATGTSATQVLKVNTIASNSVASGGSPNENLTFDTTSAIVKGTSINPLSLGV